MAVIIIMFTGTDPVAKMRIMLPAKVTKLAGVGGVVCGPAPSAARPFLKDSHLARPPKLLVKL